VQPGGAAAAENAFAVETTHGAVQLSNGVSNEALITLHGTLPPAARAVELRYVTRTGALLRCDGAIAGAFDREHAEVVLPPSVAPRALELSVELRSLPVAGLPSGPGVRWALMLRGAHQKPERVLRWRAVDAEDARVERRSTAPAGDRQASASGGDLPLIGHAHLDVAWLWTYAETRRKALRTFATAVSQLEREPDFVFAQSQPQLYAFVAEEDAELSGRVERLARAGRFDASGAALWVEPDCNLPSGESLLRQLAFGVRYAVERLGTEPSVAWLPDCFGFPSTLPTLLAHAGIRRFATAKLGWNETTPFPHRRFWWEGPDGSRILAASLAAYEGPLDEARAALARERAEPLVLGYGDGGGGVTAAMLAAAPRTGRWTRLDAWFDALEARAEALPVHRDELYLEFHRGVATTHHDIKSRNAALERALEAAEELTAWALVLRASPFFRDEMRGKLHAAWEIVLRNQFHDVLPGTSIAAVYADVRSEYERAETLVAQVAESSAGMLPRAPLRPATALCPVAAHAGGFRFENGALAARVAADGTLLDLRVPGGENLVRRAHELAAYRDRPRAWEAWNIDREYRTQRLSVVANGCEIVDGGLQIRYLIGASPALARITLAANEPFLRIALAIDWHERRTLVRIENEFDLPGAAARFGVPHGTLERPVEPRTEAERAKFEFTAQRFARIASAKGGVALLSLDTYGWSLAGDAQRVALGHSLLRGTSWPDESADRGVQAFDYAYAPLSANAVAAPHSIGELEREWRRFAGLRGVALFTSADPSVLVTATKPAEDGDGVIVRIRECEGSARDVRLACAARAREVSCVDALERPVPGSAVLRDGTLEASLDASALRSFRVRFA
jgi:alpha-mannosidase